MEKDSALHAGHRERMRQKLLAGDPALCRQIAENAAREIPVYSWSEIASQFDEFFGEVAD